MEVDPDLNENPGVKTPIKDMMDLSDDFLCRPTTPNKRSPALFLNTSPMFETISPSPLNKRLNKLLIDCPIPSKRLDFCNTFTSTPTPSFRRRNISTCPQIRNKYQLNSSVRCYATGNSKPKSTKTTIMEYINPFSPFGKVETWKKIQPSISSSSNLQTGILCDNINSDESNNSDTNLRKPKLYEMNIERFNQEFIELEEIGRGKHGYVYKCLNRMNGCFYAVKKSSKEVVNGPFERIVRNEVYAHGILDHPNLVRNYSSWTENGFVYIQNEYCNGGSLREYAEEHVFTEVEARTLLLQIARGLCYIHEKKLAHMDIKPDNIFLHEKGKVESLLLDNNISTASSSKSNEATKELIYKIGDFGHVVSLGELCVEDGDCRYLSNEIIQDNYGHLDKADIFALGLTIYEIISRQTLPKNGEEWQDIRKGHLKYLDEHSTDLNELLKTMIKADPMERPSAHDICKRLTLDSKSTINDYDLVAFLQQINNNVNILQHKVDFAGRYTKVVCRFISNKWGSFPKRPTAKGRIFVGKKQQRSNSTTLF